MQTRRALLSVYYKDGLASLACALVRHGIELVSTGGTAKKLAEWKLPHKLIEDITGWPEMLDGRVKTLNPIVHGGLLYIRGNAAHEATVKEHGIGPIDFVVVNLYPFESIIAKPSVLFAEAIENIDIGGPAMLRGGAKNHEFVTPICDPRDYTEVIAQLDANHGCTTLALRRRLAARVFAHTGAYDTLIGNWLSGVAN